MTVKRDALDDVFSKLIREASDFTCQSCAKNFRHDPAGLHAAHIHTRKHRSTRWHGRLGAIAACASCHRRYTDFPLEWADFCRRHLGDAAYDEAKRLAWQSRKYTPAEKAEMKAHYRNELERLKAMRAMGAIGILEFQPYE